METSDIIRKYYKCLQIKPQSSRPLNGGFVKNITFDLAK